MGTLGLERDRFEWATHGVVVANAPWGRPSGNRKSNVHPYTVRRYETRAAEGHRAVSRSQDERRSQWTSRARREEHHK